MIPFQSNWIIGSLLLVQTMFLGSTFRSWLHVTLAFLAGVTIVVIRNRHANQPVPADSSPSEAEQSSRLRQPLMMALAVMIIIAITGAWRLGAQLGESINPIYVAIDVLTHSALFVSLLIWTIRYRHGHSAMLCLGLLVVLFCIAAGGASQSIATQSTIALAACVGFALASQAILSSTPNSDDAIMIPESSIDGRPPRMGLLFSLITLSILLMATSMIANGASIVLPSIRDNLQQSLHSKFDAVGERFYVGGTRYVRGSQLGSIRKHMLGDPQEVALRIFSDCAPGYMRGHAFDLYRGRRWYSAARTLRERPASLLDHSETPVSDGRAKLEEPGKRPLNRFELVASSNEQLVNLEIHNDPLKGTFAFVPLSTRWIEARSNEIMVTHHGTILHGVDPTSPYVAGVATTGKPEPLDSQRRAVLLRVPPEVSGETSRVANEVCGTLSTTSDKIAAVSRYFQGEYTYSLNPKRSPRRVDPLVHFLRTKHDAHCEYFASASVLVLRSAGVPTRYVTGYIADEYDQDELWWVARNSDAHAWAEAYDDATRTWVPVESTPGRTYLTVDPNVESDQTSGLFDVFGNDDAEDDDSFLSRTIGWIMSIRATEPLMIIFRIAQLPLFCVLAFLLWSRYLKPSEHVSDSVDQRSRRMLSKVDRRLRKYSLVRAPGETLYQFANRIDALRSDQDAPAEARERLASFALWYREYAKARYQGHMPTPYS